MASQSRDCSPKQRSIIIDHSQTKKTKNMTPVSSIEANVPTSPALLVTSEVPPNNMSMHSNSTSNNMSRGSPTMPPPGSGPSRQRSLRDRLKDGITGSFTWQ